MSSLQEQLVSKGLIQQPKRIYKARNERPYNPPESKEVERIKRQAENLKRNLEEWSLWDDLAFIPYTFYNRISKLLQRHTVEVSPHGFGVYASYSTVMSLKEDCKAAGFELSATRERINNTGVWLIKNSEIFRPKQKTLDPDIEAQIQAKLRETNGK